MSFSDDYDSALKSAGFWRATLLKNVFDSDISDPRQLQQEALNEVSDKELERPIDIMTSTEDSISSIEKYFKAGFTGVHVHSSSPDEMRFIQQFSKRVLSYFKKSSTASIA